MLLTNHVLSGALIGARARGPGQAFVAGVASHFVLDAIPHEIVQRGESKSLLRRNLVDELLLTINPLVLGTGRAEETGREHPFTRFLAGLRQSGMVLEIPLEPLDAQETAELARLESAKPLESGNFSVVD